MVAGVACVAGDAVEQTTKSAALPTYGYTVVRTYPHDPTAFTQGLQYVDGFLYEGTGQNGQSSIRKVNLETGVVLQRRDLAKEHFGEGITVWNDEVYQLTWQSGIGFVYDRQTFAPKRTFRYTGEGWGLTRDADGLIMSDGTDTLRFVDPATFAERRRVKVTAAGAAVPRLNELEYVKGEIFANVWTTDEVARIDPATGRVTGWVDLGHLLTDRERASTDVMNGIAYDAAGDRLFVTGKWWPKLFEVRLQRR
ncbi:MAG: glutamine cyclotransferase [Acidobacteria bacterium RIFCSPLOWO2_02_FULL_65_29]|nr:MAG: glutamine cyclotransferase [Acidobacteria bacterium RIFCSPLOWO2_02_FULL_65_29]